MAGSGEKKPIGLYIHVPFCDGKCPYCDFYSLSGDDTVKDRYTAALCRVMDRWAERCGPLPVKTVYFGGGTPSLLGPARLARLLEKAAERFSLLPGAEITLEANPTRVDASFFRGVRAAGFDRLSMGLQSADREELRLLGRRHSPEDVKAAVTAARSAGFENISLDLMLGLPGGSCEKLGRSVEFAAGLGVEHLSAYILKVEPGTPFAARGVRLPDDDETADQYLFLTERLARLGYGQYEISNFAVPGRESRHNLVYWRGEEYLGLGPGAHSFLNGRRFRYPRDLDGFLAGNGPADDGEGGTFSEYAMLRLRLSEGLTRNDCRERFGEAGERAFLRLLERAEQYPPRLVRRNGDGFSFTPEGFLVSNALLVVLLD